MPGYLHLTITCGIPVNIALPLPLSRANELRTFASMNSGERHCFSHERDESLLPHQLVLSLSSIHCIALLTLINKHRTSALPLPLSGYYAGARAMVSCFISRATDQLIIPATVSLLSPSPSLCSCVSFSASSFISINSSCPSTVTLVCSTVSLRVNFRLPLSLPLSSLHFASLSLSLSSAVVSVSLAKCNHMRHSERERNKKIQR